MNALKTILVIVLKQIHDYQSGHIKSNLTEELKLSVLKCIIAVLNRSTYDVLEKFYTSEQNLIISKIAITCVDIVNNEKYRKLR